MNRADSLTVSNIPDPTAKPLLRRLVPLERRYWMHQGKMSLQVLMLSAYLQGVQDCATLSAQGKFPVP